MQGQRLSVLFVSTSLDTGGAQRFLSTLLTHLDREKFQPTLVLLRDEVGYPLADDVDVEVLDYRGVWSFPRTVRRLRNIIRDRHPMLVCSNVNATNILTGFALPADRSRPYWVARFGSSPERDDSKLRQIASRQILWKADRVVANSPGLATETAERYPLIADRTETIGNPTDFQYLDLQLSSEDTLASPKEIQVIIAVGRLYKCKRYDLMLQTIKKTLQKHSVELWICGDGPERPILEKQIDRLKLKENVKLLGFCSNPHLLMSRADLFLMTSDHEGSPNALIEAQGLGLPAVSTNCPHGPSEIIREARTGYLAEVGNVESIVQAVEKFLNAPERLLPKEEIRDVIRSQFDATKLVRKWEDLFLSCVNSLNDCNEVTVLSHQAS